RCAVVVDGRPASEARHTVVQRSVRAPQPHRIDAVFQIGRPWKLHVGGRESQHSAKLLAAHDRFFDGKAVAQQAGSLRHVAFLQKGADADRRDDLCAFVAEGIDQGDTEAVPLAGLHEKCRTTLPVLAEMEVEACDGVADPEVAVKDTGYEFLGTLPCERPGEGLLDHSIESEPSKEPCLHRRRRQDEKRDIGTKYGARVRLEGQHQRRDAAAPSLLECPLENGLVAAMHTVEIADCDHAAPQLDGYRRISGNALELSGHHCYRNCGMIATGWRP